MKPYTSLLTLVVAGLAALGLQTACAQEHRATRLGNPATRFADPLHTPDDLRQRFGDRTLWADMASILRQAGWPGDMDDLLAAARTAAITEIQIQPGTIMPFMSSRRNGRPVALRQVLWAGEEPTPAYVFNLSSKGRRYRCVTPKACSNFYVEDIGTPSLSVDCDAPAEVFAGRAVLMCLTLRNSGDSPEPAPLARIALDPEATLTRIAKGGVRQGNEVFWQLPALAPQGEAQVCVEYVRARPGVLPASWTASGSVSASVGAQCQTRVVGIPAILLEVVDLADPIEVGQSVTYQIRVRNQGTADSTDLRIVATLPETQEFVSAQGATDARCADRTVTVDPLPVLAPGAEASWTVDVRALTAGDVRFHTELRSGQLDRPVAETESTRQY